MSTAEESTAWRRIEALAAMILQLRQRIARLEARVAALEQSLRQAWFR